MTDEREKMDGWMVHFLKCISGLESNLGPLCYEATVLSAFHFIFSAAQHTHTDARTHTHTRTERTYISTSYDRGEPGDTYLSVRSLISLHVQVITTQSRCI